MMLPDQQNSKILAIQDSAWVKIEAFAHHVAHGMLRGGQNVVDLPSNGLRCPAIRFQPTLSPRRPIVSEFPA